jgi:hypothetical protein
MSGQIDIESIPRMRGLIEAMQTPAAEGGELMEYATTWVTQKDGFEPSPVCALRPFARAMEAMESAFNDAFSTYQQRWTGLTEGVARSLVDFEVTEGKVTDSFDALLHRRTRVYVNGKLAYE